MSAWHCLVHLMGADYGAPYGTWVWGNFWSGFGSDIGEVTLAGGLLAVCRKHNCHTRRCWRLGHYDFTDGKTSLTYRLCRRCHPRHPGKPLTRLHVTRMHEGNREQGERLTGCPCRR